MVFISDELKAKQPLLDLGILTTPEDIDYLGFRELETCMEYLSYKDKQIFMRVIGLGGYMDYGSAISDLVRLHRVTGVLMASAWSAHTIVWAACPFRYIMPSGSIRVHQVQQGTSADTFNQSKTLRQQLESVEIDNAYLANIYSSACGSKEYGMAYWMEVLSMTQSTEPLDCVAFMLISGNCILVEKRSAKKHLFPGALAIPGGHIDEGGVWRMQWFVNCARS